MCVYTICIHTSSDSHPSGIPQPGHSPQIIPDLSRPQNAITNTSKRIDQLIIHKSTKHQPRIIQTPTQNHRKITTDILDSIPTSLKQHPTACSKSFTSPNDQPQIIQEPTQNHPNTTPNIINPSHTLQPRANAKSTNTALCR